MIIPDVNLLLYAMISAFPEHERSRAWWEEVVNGTDQVGLAEPAIFGFLRLATHGRVLETPMDVTVAVGHVREWLSWPNISLLTPGHDHLEIALGLLEKAGTAANLTTDVQLAAHAIERSAELHSHDADFGRFAALNWVDPLT